MVKNIAFDSFEILGPHMTQVPGPDGNRGFGGKCLPKDIRAFSTIHKSELLETPNCKLEPAGTSKFKSSLCCPTIVL